MVALFWIFLGASAPSLRRAAIYAAVGFVISVGVNQAQHQAIPNTVINAALNSAMVLASFAARRFVRKPRPQGIASKEVRASQVVVKPWTFRKHKIIFGLLTVFIVLIGVDRGTFGEEIPAISIFLVPVVTALMFVYFAVRRYISEGKAYLVTADSMPAWSQTRGFLQKALTLSEVLSVPLIVVSTSAIALMFSENIFGFALMRMIHHR